MLSTTAWGFAEPRRRDALEGGIGMSNVNERLKVLYGQDFSLQIESHPGKGNLHPRGNS